jgi:hypothetical protein
METTPAVYACLVATAILVSSGGLDRLDPGIGTEKGWKIQRMLSTREQLVKPAPAGD